MKLKLLIKLIAAALPALAVMAFVNYIADPALVLRDGEYERVLANAVSDGKNASVNANFNERKFQRYFVSGLSKPFDGIVLGSSRAMLIPCEAFEGEVFCNGLTGAVAEDMIGVVALYAQNDLLPGKVYISVDPWLFNESHNDTRYRELVEEYNSISGRLRVSEIPKTVITSGWFSKVTTALTPSYFQVSIKNLNNRPSRPVVPADPATGLLTKLSDGSVVYPKDYENRTASQKSAEIKTLITENNIYHSQNYIVISPVIITRFAGLINYLAEEGVEVVFILCPLHPELYEFVSSDPDYGIFLEAEDFIRKFARDRGITLIGSFDPSVTGATEDDFYDAYHPTREFLFLMCEGA